MPDVIGYRANVAVLIPSTNTVVEAEYNMMAPHGVTIHAGRMYVGRPQLHSDEATVQLLDDVRADVPNAVRDVVTLQPDQIVMGMSAPTFYGGLEGCRQYEREITELAGGVPVTSGPASLVRALDALEARTIGVLSPYQPVNDKQVVNYFEEAGRSITGYLGMRTGSATGIAELTEDEVRPKLTELAASKPDAIVQVGTNLAMVRLAGEAERWLGLPVLAINATSMWSALRDLGIDDGIRGFGCLLRDH
ncbi:arylmalonate decarboxylase [Egicoccus sp. AB-alg2]|uniref:maleate cis-trans isomerase family protein n=1 Tax=Egicoccus sp. AB-alg2 TaxID=3242693 RepID=UPI00359CBCD5